MRGPVQREEKVPHSLGEEVEVAHLQHEQVIRLTLRDPLLEHINGQKVSF